MSSIPVRWPHGQTTMETVGEDWLKAASNADVSIPTGCLGGSCGACEIEVNGKMVRACISTVPPSKSGELVVTFATVPDEAAAPQHRKFTKNTKKNSTVTLRAGANTNMEVSEPAGVYKGVMLCSRPSDGGGPGPLHLSPQVDAPSFRPVRRSPK